MDIFLWHQADGKVGLVWLKGDRSKILKCWTDTIDLLPKLIFETVNSHCRKKLIVQKGRILWKSNQPKRHWLCWVQPFIIGNCPSRFPNLYPSSSTKSSRSGHRDGGEDGGLLKVIPRSSSDTGRLAVSLDETTNFDDNQGVLRIQKDGQAFFN